MASHLNETLADLTVILDNEIFIGCTLQRCRVIYAGGDFTMDPATNVIECTLECTGAANRVMKALQAFNLLSKNLPGKPQPGSEQPIQ